MESQPTPRGATLAEIAASGRRLVVQCGRCPNRRLCRPSDLDLPMEMQVSAVAEQRMLKCGDCGSTEVLVYPESNRDARKVRIR